MLDDGHTAASTEDLRAPGTAAERHRAGEAEGGRQDDERVSSSVDAHRPLRAIFISLEFSADTFSGNGTLAQACVRGLASAGVDVVVVAARPETKRDDGADDDEAKRPKLSSSSSSSDAAAPPAPRRLHGASALAEVPVPRELWGRLDARSPWREFRDGAAKALRISKRKEFDVVFAVDWTGVAAAEGLPLSESKEPAAAEEKPGRSERGRRPPLVYLNYRVFARSAETAGERELVRRAEGGAVAVAAAASVALCAADAEDLELLAAREEEVSSAGEAEEGPRRRPAVSVLLPPLRREFAEMPPPPPPSESESGSGSESGGGKENVDGGSGGGSGSGSNGQQQQRRRRNLLLCCVRLSPEKEPHRFVAVVERLARSGALSELGVVPALVGGGDGAYAEGLRERMRRLEGPRRGPGGAAAAGAAAKEEPPAGASAAASLAPVEALVEAGFVGAAELGSRFFDRALLNFHPCLADAYGMSAVEAGSRGAPSVIHSGGSGGDETEEKERKKKPTVGASALLRAEEGESISLDLSLPAEEVAARVEELLRANGAGSLSLREVGERAERRARSWGERQHGEALAALARRCLRRVAASEGAAAAPLPLPEARRVANL